MRLLAPGPRQTTQDSAYLRRKYLRAVSRLTALAREAATRHVLEPAARPGQDAVREP